MRLGECLLLKQFHNKSYIYIMERYHENMSIIVGRLKYKVRSRCLSHVNFLRINVIKLDLLPVDCSGLRITVHQFYGVILRILIQIALSLKWCGSFIVCLFVVFMLIGGCFKHIEILKPNQKSSCSIHNNPSYILCFKITNSLDNMLHLKWLSYTKVLPYSEPQFIFH